MDILRSLPTERVVHKIVLRRGREVFRTSYDVSYSHKVVVDYVRKVIGRHTVALYENIVLEVGVVHLYRSVHHIFVGTRPLGGNVLPYNVGFAEFKPEFYFLFGKI